MTNTKTEGAMTLEEAKRRIREIEAQSGYEESSHVLDDRLRADFIRHVSEGEGESAKIAALLLTTETMDRWYA